MSDDTAVAWQRLPGEPALWFGRFVFYRELGVKRSLDKAYELARHSEGLKGVRAGPNWYATADKWRWSQRAEAWDDGERAKFLAGVEARRVDAQRERLAFIERLLGQSYVALGKAKLDEIDEAAAREMIGALRMLFFDALKAQRLEFGESTEIVAAEHEPFNADEMAAAMAEVEQWRAERMKGESGLSVD